MRSSSSELTSSRAAVMRSAISLLGAPRARVDVHRRAVGVEARLEERDEVGGDRGVGDEGVLEVGLAERRLRLAEVLGDGAQDDDLAPGQPGGRGRAG